MSPAAISGLGVNGVVVETAHSSDCIEEFGVLTSGRLGPISFPSWDPEMLITGLGQNGPKTPLISHYQGKYASKALCSSSQKGVRSGVWAEQSLAGDRLQRRLKRGVRRRSHSMETTVSDGATGSPRSGQPWSSWGRPRNLLPAFQDVQLELSSSPRGMGWPRRSAFHGVDVRNRLLCPDIMAASSS
jgi:hypothetical protein